MVVVAAVDTVVAVVVAEADMVVVEVDTMVEVVVSLTLSRITIPRTIILTLCLDYGGGGGGGGWRDSRN